LEKLNKDNMDSNSDNGLDLLDIFKILWERKYFIVIMTSIFILTSIIFALSLPNLYKSDALLMPQQEESSMSSMLNQYSSVANLAGIPLSGSSGSKAQEAISRITSYDFFSKHFVPNIAIEDLLASEKWDSSTNKYSYDKSIFNSESGKWIDGGPSLQKAYKIYLECLSISLNKKTSFVSVSVKHISPFAAQEWTQLIIDQIDKVMRNIDREESTKAVNFLNTLALSVKYEGIKKNLSSLQEDQMKKLMMIEASDNYVFKVLDSPIVPERKFEPRRSVIVILGMILGFLLSIIISLTQHYTRKSHAK
jgi:LPS O-antigen subunit length determinant protein (WzzB/FepE family)